MCERHCGIYLFQSDISFNMVISSSIIFLQMTISFFLWLNILYKYNIFFILSSINWHLTDSIVCPLWIVLLQT
jgi:hypothetical protein